MTGPEKILSGESSDLITRRRAAAALGRRETVETQRWSAGWHFQGKIIVDSRAGALQTARKWRRRDTVWTDGSRIDSGEVGAACDWQSPSDWTGRRFYLGTNKEVFDAETFAIYQALRILDRRQESGHQCMVFVDSTATNDWVRTNTPGPGQRFAIAAMEVWDRVLAHDNEVTIRWVPAHSRVAGNEQADTYAKAAARRSAPHNNDDVPDGLLTEASLSHMSSSATEVRSWVSTEWIASHVRP